MYEIPRYVNEIKRSSGVVSSSGLVTRSDPKRMVEAMDE